jgi:hypothetical protein
LIEGVPKYVACHSCQLVVVVIVVVVVVVAWESEFKRRSPKGLVRKIEE